MDHNIKAVTPLESENQRIFKVDGETHDLVLLNTSGIVYINSISREYLQKVAKTISIENPMITDIRGKERPYDGLSGYILESHYKTLSGGIKSIKTLFQRHDALISILEEVMV